MTEPEEAERLAQQILDRPYADPDDDFALLARQLLRRGEEVARLARSQRESEAQLVEIADYFDEDARNHGTIAAMVKARVERLRAAIRDERRACAEIVMGLEVSYFMAGPFVVRAAIAAAIRERGEVQT